MQTLRAGDIAVVTGGARGIGLAVVRALAAEGVGVACLDQAGADYSAFETTCREAGVAFRSSPVDVRDQGGVFAAVEQAGGLGRVSYAVNCAGVDSPGDSAEVSPQAWDRVMDIDLNGVLFACQAQYRLMAGHGGSIVNIASMSGSIINRSAPHAAYCTAKAGVIHLSKALAVEWASKNIRVNSVSPGYTMTELTAHNPPELNASFAEQTPMGRMAEVHEIAGPVLFLLGSTSSYITATDLLVDGGFTAW